MANKLMKMKKNVPTDEAPVDELKSTIRKLRTELEAEQRISKQLRREKTAEVQRIREEERLSASTSLSNLTHKLQTEKQKEIELQKEAVRSKLEAEFDRILKMKEQEAKKLRQDLSHVQYELAEEVSKRGLSTSAWATFESERQKLRRQVNELNTVKKHLETALQTAAETEKMKNIEIRRLKESNKTEIDKVTKESDTKIKELLDDLKAKDNLLAIMDVNLYADKSSEIQNNLARNLTIEELLKISVEAGRFCSWSDMNADCENEHQPAVGESIVLPNSCALQNISLQKRLYQLEKQAKFANILHRCMTEKNGKLITRNEQLEEEVKHLRNDIHHLNKELSANQNEVEHLIELVENYEANSSFNEDDFTNEEMNCEKLVQQCQDLQSLVAKLQDECQEKDRKIKLFLKTQHRKSNKYERKVVRFVLPFDDDNIEGSEFNNNEQIVQSVLSDYEKLMSEHLKLEKSYSDLSHISMSKLTLEKNSCHADHEMKNSESMRQELKHSSEQIQLLRYQLNEAYERNEELEFRVLELEDSTQVDHPTIDLDINDLEVFDENKEICDQPFTKLSIENVRKLTSSLSDSEDDNAMIQSFSTMTSGFDEASCMSFEEVHSEMPEIVEDVEYITVSSEKDNECIVQLESALCREDKLEKTSAIPNVEDASINEHFETSEINKEVKIQELQNHVITLQENDSWYCKILEKLDSIASMLHIFTMPNLSQEQNVSDFFCDSCKAIQDTLQKLHDILMHNKGEISLNKCDFLAETVQTMESCMIKIQETSKTLILCQNSILDSDLKMSQLEKEQINDFGRDLFNIQINDLMFNCPSVHTKDLPVADTYSSSSIKTLQQLSLQQMHQNFINEFKELHSLVRQCMPVKLEAQVLDEVSDSMDLVDKQVTKLKSSSPFLEMDDYDSLLIKSFSEWLPISNREHLEIINQCLLQQIIDLQKEKAEIQEQFSVKENDLVNLSDHIRQLDDSNSSLEKDLECSRSLQIAESKQYSELQLQYDNLKSELAEAELKIEELQNENDILMTSESVLKEKLLSMQESISIVKGDLQEKENENSHLMEQLSKLTTQIETLSWNNCSMKEKIKSYQSEAVELQDSIDELEHSISKAYEELFNNTRLRDSLSERLQLAEYSNVEAQAELESYREEKKRNAAETSALINANKFKKTALLLLLAISIKREKVEISHLDSETDCGEATGLSNSRILGLLFNFMKKYVSSLNFQRSVDMLTKSLNIEEKSEPREHQAPGEEAYWLEVEDLRDLYNLRTAQCDTYWRHLEELMEVDSRDLLRDFRSIVTASGHHAPSSVMAASTQTTEPDDNEEQTITNLKQQLEVQAKNLSEKIKELENLKEQLALRLQSDQQNMSATKIPARPTRDKPFASQIPLSIQQVRGEQKFHHSTDGENSNSTHKSPMSKPQRASSCSSQESCSSQGEQHTMLKSEKVTDLPLYKSTLTFPYDVAGDVERSSYQINTSASDTGAHAESLMKGQKSKASKDHIVVPTSNLQ